MKRGLWHNEKFDVYYEDISTFYYFMEIVPD